MDFAAIARRLRELTAAAPGASWTVFADVAARYAEREDATAVALEHLLGAAAAQDGVPETLTSLYAETFPAVEPLVVKTDAATLAAVDTAPPAADEDETPDDAPADDPLAFSIPVGVIEGVDTGDHRYIEPGALSHRSLPLPLMAITKTTMGHDDAELVGNIESWERYDASGLENPKTGEPYGEGIFAWRGTGHFTTLDNATEVKQLIDGKFLRGVSVDMSDVEAVTEFLDDDGNVVDPDDMDDDDFLEIMFGGGNFRDKFTAARVMGATVCPFPAFEGAYIETMGSETPAHAEGDNKLSVVSHDVYGERDPVAIVASGAPNTGPMRPPRAWYEDPQLTELTPITITEDGHIFGHFASWFSCHTGISGECVPPPHSRIDYADFLTGAVLTAENDLMAAGPLTVGTGHADLSLDRTATLAHYDNTGTQVATCSVGEDAFGPWINGSINPDATELQIRRLRASALSGDWRPHGPRLELVAVLAVNTPGYIVPRSRVASGAVTALVAAGAPDVLRVKHARDRANPETFELLETMREFLSVHYDREATAARANMQAGLDAAAARAKSRMAVRA